MARDTTAQEHIETTLYTAGVHNSGGLAEAIIDGLRENGMLVEDKPQLVTPTSGAMTQDEHTAFILRVFMYLVEKRNQRIKVDLSDVMHKTRGRQLQIQLNGHIFEARTIADLILPTAEEKRNMQ